MEKYIESLENDNIEGKGEEREYVLPETRIRKTTLKNNEEDYEYETDY